jgi:hypothetical protein
MVSDVSPCRTLTAVETALYRSWTVRGDGIDDGLRNQVSPFGTWMDVTSTRWKRDP